MTVDDAIAHAREWQQHSAVHPVEQAWSIVCMVLADEVERLRSDVQRALDANEEYHGDALALEQERDLLRACLERVVNVYLVDDYYSGESRESVKRAYVDRLMTEQREKMSEGKNDDN